MAGLFLLRNLEGNSVFDVEKVRTCLRGIPGIRNWDEDDPRHHFFCQFDFGDDSTIVHMLIDHLQFISIEGMGNASLYIACEIGKRYGAEIHAVDQEYSFDIPLATVASLADFKDKISRKVGAENLPGG